MMSTGFNTRHISMTQLSEYMQQQQMHTKTKVFCTVAIRLHVLKDMCIKKDLYTIKFENKSNK